MPVGERWSEDVAYLMPKHHHKRIKMILLHKDQLARLPIHGKSLYAFLPFPKKGMLLLQFFLWKDGDSEILWQLLPCKLKECFACQFENLTLVLDKRRIRADRL